VDIERVNATLVKAIGQLQAEEVEALNEFRFSYGHLMLDAGGAAFTVVDTDSKKFRPGESDPEPVVKRFRYKPRDAQGRQDAFDGAMRWAKKKGKSIVLSRIVMGMKKDGLIDEELHESAVPEGGEDVTKKQVEKNVFSIRIYEFGLGDGNIKPAKRGKLNKSQQKVMKIVGHGLDLPLISNVLLFAEPFKRLKKIERKAVVALAMGGLLKLYKVPGSLPGAHKASSIGATAPNHYRLVSA